MQPVTAVHIDAHPDKCGGKPCVAGTRIRVWDIHVWHNVEGCSAEEIVAEFPQLTLADVYAALAYYHDYREEIHAQMEAVEARVRQMRAGVTVSYRGAGSGRR